MADELYRSRAECKVSSKPRDPYYVHTASSREPVKPSTAPIFKAPKPSHNPPTQDYPPKYGAESTLINPKHSPEICPPSSSRWQKLKDENEQRKSREVTRMSFGEVAKISGRDQRGFKQEEGWTEEMKNKEEKRVTRCCMM
ncbi:hypothetical protein N0V86_004519 [Didymella sp. IMI 355093]|nr:hypothetical protein N0V86_004519 [Didymella sp. IMI 355093]